MMVFKLVRIDGQEVYKVVLTNGKHVIGRGKFLHNKDFNADKRVSRNHAELEVTCDSVTLTALHLNPCFYRRINSSDVQLLQKDSSLSLCNGDMFGLAPDAFWYELILLSDQYTVEGNIEIKETIENSIDNNKKNAVEVKEHNDNKGTGSTTENEIQVDSSRSVSPSQSVKRSHDSEGPNEVDLKKVKTEPNDENEYKTTEIGKIQFDEARYNVKTEPDVAQGAEAVPTCSNAQTASLDADNRDRDSKDAVLTSSTRPNPPLRERCIYGANCYRRNLQHKAKFSHPTDADWGPGERGSCPYGRACRRADPRHWTQHDHPPGVQPPHVGTNAPNGPGMQVVHRNGQTFYINADSVNFNDDEDSDGDNDSDNSDNDSDNSDNDSDNSDNDSDNSDYDSDNSDNDSDNSDNDSDNSDNNSDNSDGYYHSDLGSYYSENDSDNCKNADNES